MTAIKIHGVPPSTFTRTVRLACHEKGIDYELVPTMPGEITALNPFRKIPAVSHGDLVLFETTAILRYLDRPCRTETVAGRLVGIALCDQWVSAVCDLLVNAALRYMASRYGSCRCRPRCSGNISTRRARIMPIFDRQLGKTRYLAGDGVTAADLFLAPVLFYFPDIAELRAIADAAPNCARWARDMGGRRNVKPTEPQHKPQLAA